MLYGVVGTTNFDQIAILILEEEVPKVFLVAFSFVLISILFKLAVAPFHIWAPDVYEGSHLTILQFSPL